MTYPKLISIVLLLAVVFNGKSQDEIVDSTIFSIDELQEDFQFWRTELEKHHPILYRYNSKESFQQFFDSLYAEIDRPMSRSDFFRLIAPSTFFVKCSHVQIWASSEMSKRIIDSDYIIPIDVRWYEEHAYVSYNYSNNPELKAGTEIISVNGVDLSEMYPKFISILPRDGYCLQKPKYWVNRLFYYYYHLWYDLYESYDIVYLSNGNEKSISVPGMSVIEMRESKKGQPKIGLSKPEAINLNFIDSLNSAYLQIGSFTQSDIKRENKKGFKKVIDDCFKKIGSSKVDNLIIDLQENGGGDPYFALYLCQYFMNEPFIFKEEYRKVKDYEESEYSKRSKKTILSDKTTGVKKPFKNSFKGKVYLLVDGGSSSASGEVVSVVHNYKRGPIIGEEVGGSHWILTSKWFSVGKYELPNTKLKYSAPRRTSVLPNQEKDNGYGLIPEYQISPTIESYLKGKDLALIKACELIHDEKLHTTK